MRFTICEVSYKGGSTVFGGQENALKFVTSSPPAEIEKVSVNDRRLNPTEFENLRANGIWPSWISP